jgi:hypothetical protein
LPRSGRWSALRADGQTINFDWVDYSWLMGYAHVGDCDQRYESPKESG